MVCLSSFGAGSDYCVKTSDLAKKSSGTDKSSEHIYSGIFDSNVDMEGIAGTIKTKIQGLEYPDVTISDWRNPMVVQTKMCAQYSQVRASFRPPLYHD